VGEAARAAGVIPICCAMVAHIPPTDGPAATGARTVTTVRITLPDELARELAAFGLLEPQVLETILRDRLRATRIADLATIRAKLRAKPRPPMTNDEIDAEIAAYRAEQRRAPDLKSYRGIVNAATALGAINSGP